MSNILIISVGRWALIRNIGIHGNSVTNININYRKILIIRIIIIHNQYRMGE